MVGPGYTTIGISNETVAAIRECMKKYQYYRTPTEFVLAAVREKLEEFEKRKIDERKLEALFMRESQIKAEHLKKAS